MSITKNTVSKVTTYGRPKPGDEIEAEFDGREIHARFGDPYFVVNFGDMDEEGLDAADCDALIEFFTTIRDILRSRA